MCSLGLSQTPGCVVDVCVFSRGGHVHLCECSFSSLCGRGGHVHLCECSFIHGSSLCGRGSHVCLCECSLVPRLLWGQGKKEHGTHCLRMLSSCRNSVVCIIVDTTM